MAKNDKQTAQQDVMDDIGQMAQAGMMGAAIDAAAKKAIATKVRAKMRVERIDPTPNGEAYIHMRPVTSGSPENHELYCHTPGGACTIGLVSKEAARMFVLNADYYVDFTPAD